MKRFNMRARHSLSQMLVFLTCHEKGARKIFYAKIGRVPSLIIATIAVAAVGLSFTPLRQQLFKTVVAETNRSSKDSATRVGAKQVTLQAAKRGFPHVNFADGEEAIANAQQASGRPAIAGTSADFNSDGIKDLITADGSGTLKINRGNPDTIYPHSPSARQRKAEGMSDDSPFSADERTFSLNFSPDFLTSGDFNADGNSDLLATAKKADQLVLMAGDGQGNFAAPLAIKLGGKVTAFTAGEIGRADGQTDVAVAILNKNGAQLLVFEHPEGAFKHKPEVFVLPSAANDLSIGHLDKDSYGDVAVANGSNLTIVHGRGQAYPLDLKADLNIKRPAAVMQTRKFAFDISALATGKFTGSRGDSLAILATDGSIYTLEPQREATDSTRNNLTAAELNKTKKLSFAPAEADSELRKFAALEVDSPRNEQEADQAGQLMVDTSALKEDSEKTIREKLDRLSADFAKLSPSEQNRITTEKLRATKESNQKRKEGFERTLSSRPIPLATFKVEALISDARLANVAQSIGAHKIITARVSDSGRDDLILVDSIGKQIQIIAQVKTEDQKPRAELISFDSETAPLAIVPMRLNSDGISDLVVLRENSPVPLILQSMPTLTFVVNTTDDNSGGDCLGTTTCALRRAIFLANTNAGMNLIAFNIPGAGVHTIHPLSNLPDITNTITIDGTTQPGFAGKPLIEIEGDLMTGAHEGLKIRGSNSVVRGLAINHITSTFNGASQIGGSGITILSTSSSPNVNSVTIEGNFLGTDPTGEIKKGNDANGVHIFDANNNTIGGTTAQSRNVLSGNGNETQNKRGVGLAITGGNNNHIQGNFIGTDASGVVKLGNFDGVFFTGINNQFGGDAAGAGNVVSGNGGLLDQFGRCGGRGITVYGLISLADGTLVTDTNTFKGNKIGTTFNGTGPLGNCGVGFITDSNINTTVGSITESGRNVISDNGYDALYCGGGSRTSFPVSGACYIIGNNIGTDITGTIAMRNDQRNNGCVGFCLITDTVWITPLALDFAIVGSPGGTTPGGACTGGCNLISGNFNPNSFGSGGLYRSGYGLLFAVNNYLGVNRTGTAALPNRQGFNSYFGSFVFGSELGDGNGGFIDGGNLVSGNDQSGASTRAIDVGGTFEIRGNLVGLSSDGNSPILNGVGGRCGICASSLDGTETKIGGTDSLQRNYVASTTSDGTGGDGIILETNGSSTVLNNWVGLNKSGFPIGNPGAGISAAGTGRTQIGGVGSGEGNLIIGNGRAGVVVYQFTDSHNVNAAKHVTIRGNGIAINGGLGIDLVNATSADPNPSGVTPNDCLDPDDGANGLQNFPDLLAPVFNGNGTVTVDTILRSTPLRQYLIDYYQSPSADPTNYGEGSNYIGSKTVQTDGNGFVGFTFTSPNAVIPSQATITATATDELGNTSEFSCAAGVCTSGTLQQAIAAAPEFSCAQPKDIVVNVTSDEDEDPPSKGMVCNVVPNVTQGQEKCTLRAAIHENETRTIAGNGPWTIKFNIPATDANCNATTHVCTIAPLTLLPPIIKTVTIDGASQPGYTDSPLIELTGVNAPVVTNTSGLEFRNGSSGSTLRGLAINRWHESNIRLKESDSTRITGCYIGTTPDGMSPAGTGADNTIGVDIIRANDDQIGDVFQPNGGNLISNCGLGIQTHFSRGIIEGNKIGTDRTGLRALPNDIGVQVEPQPDDKSRQVYTTQIESNLISGNRQSGIDVVGDTNIVFTHLTVIIRQNLIGTSITGDGNLSNGQNGIVLLYVDGGLIEDNVIVGHNVSNPLSAGILVLNHPNYTLVSYPNSIDFLRNYIGVTKNGSVVPNKNGIIVKDGPPLDIGVFGNSPMPNVIGGNLNTGIYITGNSWAGSRISNNYIGIDSLNQALANGNNGIWLEGVKSAEISSNYISGNLDNGIFLSAGADTNQITNNRIGTEASSSHPAIGNKIGLRIVKSSNNRVSHNMISDNAEFNVLLGDVIPTFSTSTIGKADTIGRPSPLDTGTSAKGNVFVGNTISNSKVGLAITEGANENKVGALFSADNSIVGNTSGTGYGIFLGTTNINPSAASLPSGNLVIGNYVATNTVGLVIKGAQNNSIGGGRGRANAFVCNANDGIELFAENTSGNEITFNNIGVDLFRPASSCTGNGHNGISITDTGRNDIKNNIIGNNHDNGISLFNLLNGPTTDFFSVISGNQIGVLTDGSKVGNLQNGIRTENVTKVLIGVDNITSSEPKNIISGNGGDGISILGNSSLITINNSVIGTTESGVAGLGNTGSGISIDGGSGYVIGGNASVGNVIAGNRTHGILLRNSLFATIVGNSIGVVNSNGSNVALPNNLNGISIDDSSQTTIGDTKPFFDFSNVIGGNLGSGIKITGPQALAVTIKKNYIGTDASGTNLGNGVAGVHITDGANHNNVGLKDNLTAGNTIAHNTGPGVLVDGSALCCNLIDPNSIYGNGGLGIQLGGSGVPLPNDLGDGDSGPNNLQNYPEFVTALIAPNGDLLVTYKVDSAPANSSYGQNGLYVEFFKGDASLQGQTFLGNANYTLANYLAGLPGPSVVNLGKANSLGIQAGDKLVATATDADGNTSEFTSTNVGVVTGSPTATDGSIVGTITDRSGGPVAGVTITLDGTQSRKTITDSNGHYQFREVETTGFYTVSPSRANYTFSPANKSFSVLGSKTEAAFTAIPGGATTLNPLDTPEYFVRQHYLDFLGREPDQTGFSFWSDQIRECGSDAACAERRTINVSAAYFLSIEFQQTGGFVDGLYRASYGVRPQFADFMPDLRAVGGDVVVGQAGWMAQLEMNKQAFINAWVERPSFRSAYDGLGNDLYVDRLINQTRVTFTANERNALVSSLTDGSSSRARVLRKIAEDERFVNAKRNETFVMMEYFGYLRRDPDASGYQFWLNKLNQFDGNFERAEMVKSFIVSSEYRDRFR